eukprot:TRINITY_DN20677_c0_g1_i1.p1 TRINITY_DN20677_c0_g1~~TRINITY_DN20677_c0_g1_i1.p1  ORF type:complete len:230 (+),score=10.32 TRINITY_DN20677_c0_g1_i1:1-690(+)
MIRTALDFFEKSQTFHLVACYISITHNLALSRKLLHKAETENQSAPFHMSDPQRIECIRIALQSKIVQASPLSKSIMIDTFQAYSQAKNPGIARTLENLRNLIHSLYGIQEDKTGKAPMIKIANLCGLDVLALMKRKGIYEIGPVICVVNRNVSDPGPGGIPYRSGNIEKYLNQFPHVQKFRKDIIILHQHNPAQISSTLIRKYLANADYDRVRPLLGQAVLSHIKECM